MMLSSFQRGTASPERPQLGTGTSSSSLLNSAASEQVVHLGEFCVTSLCHRGTGWRQGRAWGRLDKRTGDAECSIPKRTLTARATKGGGSHTVPHLTPPQRRTKGFLSRLWLPPGQSLLCPRPERRQTVPGALLIRAQQGRDLRLPLREARGSAPPRAPPPSPPPVRLGCLRGNLIDSLG